MNRIIQFNNATLIAAYREHSVRPWRRAASGSSKQPAQKKAALTCARLLFHFPWVIDAQNLHKPSRTEIKLIQRMGVEYCRPERRPSVIFAMFAADVPKPPKVRFGDKLDIETCPVR